jgi:hypothetical protein
VVGWVLVEALVWTVPVEVVFVLSSTARASAMAAAASPDSPRHHTLNQSMHTELASVSFVAGSGDGGIEEAQPCQAR